SRARPRELPALLQRGARPYRTLHPGSDALADAHRSEEDEAEMTRPECRDISVAVKASAVRGHQSRRPAWPGLVRLDLAQVRAAHVLVGGQCRGGIGQDDPACLEHVAPARD